jgi:hypothetical protein
MFAVSGLQPVSKVTPLGFRTKPDAYVGTRETTPIGWLIPASSMITTSYLANQNLTGFLSAGVNVLPYHIEAGTVLYLGLYINGQLRSTSNNTLSGTYRNSATVVGAVQGDWATFTNSMLTFTVALLDLKTSILAGSTITVTVWASQPIWIQFDSTPTTSSYETLGVPLGLPPAAIDAISGSLAPHTIAIGVYADAA